MKRSQLFSLRIPVILFCSCPYYGIFSNARQNYRKAYRATKKNRTDVLTKLETDNYEKAIVGASKLLQFYPNSKWVDDALFLLGQSFYYQRDYNSARRKFLELKSNFPEGDYAIEVDLWLAKTDLELKEYDEAESQFTNFVNQKISKKLKGEGYYNLGKLYSARGTFDEANQAYETAIQIGIGNLEAEVMYAISVNYDSLGDYSKAAESYQNVLSLDPSEELLFDVEFKYAQMKKKQGSYDEAIVLFEKSLGNDRNKKMFPMIKMEIADCLIRKNDIDNAITAYQDITEEHKNTEYAAKAFYQLGNMYEKFQDYNAAQESFNEVKKAFSRSAYADSSEMKRRDILRLQALLKIIEMADEGITGEGVVVVTDPDSLIPEDQNIELAQMQQDMTDTLVTDFNQDPIQQNKQQDPFNDTETPTPGQMDKTQKKRVENPELKTFRVEEIDKNLFLLAELYSFRFALPDSAERRYQRLISEFPESEHAPRALYNLIYLNENVFQNSLAAQNGYNRLIGDYPDSEFTNAARKALGLPIIPTKEDSVLSLFNEAEITLHDREDPISAYQQLAMIVNRYPDSEIVPKSHYTMAWIAENRLDSLNLAFVLYDSLINRYPETEYAKSVNKKVASVKADKVKKNNMANKDSLNTVSSKIDSLPKIVDDAHPGRDENMPSVSDTNIRKEISTSSNSNFRNRQATPIGGINAIKNQLKFPETIDKKLLTGFVSVKVFIDADGKVTKTELLRRQNNDQINNTVLKVVQETKFEPAVVNGKKTASSVNVTIPLSSEASKDFFE